MRKELFFIFLLIIGIGFISALDQSRSFNYNINSNETQGGNEFLPFLDVLLKINTPEEMICKYSANQETLYNNMEGIFDETNSIVNKKYFSYSQDATYRYYVKCKNPLTTLHEPGELEIILRINSLVTGQILLSEDSPLREGRVDVTLITSKVVSQAPSLKYSLDGVKYNPVILIGSEKNWNGYIVLDKTLGEGVLSFSMSAVDLEGRPGTEILVGSAFPYDTIKPSLITDIKAISDVGEIKLEWHTTENINEFNVYRSTVANPSYTDFYKTVQKNYFYDTNLDKGRTYYYRVTSIDSSGNEADLSREVSGISLQDYEDLATGLSPVLRGKVESFIAEIESLEDKIEVINDGLSKMNAEEKDLFSRLKMNDKLTRVSKEISALKVSVEKYKEQDLTSEELDGRIESSRVKLGIFEKDIPEGLKVLEEDTRVEEITEEFIMNGLYELDNFLSEKEREQSTKETLKLIEENKIKIQSTFSLVEIKYFDGTTGKFFVVKRTINSEIERLEEAYFMEFLPSKIIENGKIEIKNLDYNFLSDNIITFGADSKEIFYFIEGISQLSELNGIESGFVALFSESSSKRGITGLSIFGDVEVNHTWMIGIVFLALIIVYFLYAKMNNYSDDYFRVLNKLSEGSRLINQNKVAESKKIYFGVKELYGTLGKKEKEKLYGKIETLYQDISIEELEEGLEELKKTKNKALLEKLERVYGKLPAIHKEKISTLFNKIKGEIENEK